MHNFIFMKKVIFILILFITQLFAIDNIVCSEYREMGDMSREKTCLFPKMKLTKAYENAVKERYSTFNLEQYLEPNIPKHNKKNQLGKGAERIYIDYKISNKRIVTIDMLAGIASFGMKLTEDNNGTIILYSISAD